MKKRILFLTLFVLITLFIVSADEGTNPRMTVKANILAPEVSIRVPDILDFGDVKFGYVSEIKNITVYNTGEIKVKITTELANSSELIFNYTKFRKSNLTTWNKIGGSYSFTIDKPSEVGGETEQSLDFMLDLTSFEGEVNEDIPNHEAEIIFWATAD